MTEYNENDSLLEKASSEVFAPVTPIVNYDSMRLYNDAAMGRRASAPALRELERRRKMKNRLKKFRAYPYAGSQIFFDMEQEYEQELEMEETGDEDEFNRKNITSLILMVIAHILATLTFSCIAPFFPQEAQRKGMSQTKVGFVFGAYELVMFFVCPLIGAIMHSVGSKFLFVIGILITGVTSTLFGLLIWSPAGQVFFYLSLTLRIFESVGAGAFLTSSFAIVAHLFPTRVSTIVGILEMVDGLGYAIGPIFGGLLYELGGYYLPFVTLGAILIACCVFSLYTLPTFTELPTKRHDENGGMTGLLRVPTAIILLLACFGGNMAFGIIEPNLSNHIAEFKLSEIVVGALFLILAGSYALFSPLVGYLGTRHLVLANILMAPSSLLVAVGLALIGPAPFFHLNKSIWLICTALFVVGTGLIGMYLPSFELMLNLAKERGYPDNFVTYGTVSGMFQSAYHLGAFVGSIAFSAIIDSIGGPWAFTIGASYYVILAALILVQVVACRVR